MGLDARPSNGAPPRVAYSPPRDAFPFDWRAVPPPPRNLSYALVLVLLGLRRAVKYEQDGKIIPRRYVQSITRFDLLARGDEDLVLWKDTKHVRAASAV